MDVERGIIQALFYDYPLEQFVETMEGSQGWGDFLSVVPDLLKWRMHSFDREELKSIWESTTQKWEDAYWGLLDVCKPLMYLKDIADEMLVKEGNAPKVKFEHLLRWRMMTQNVGEDLLTLSWLADKERRRTGNRYDFVWEDTIGIERSDWNTVAEGKRLCDIHSHLGASSDAFNIRWIHWMNKCCGRILSTKQKNGEFELDVLMNKVARDNPIHLWTSRAIDMNLMDWGGLAAVIRYRLFEMLNGKAVDVEMLQAELVEAIDSKDDRIALMKKAYRQIDASKSMGMKPNADGLSRWDYALMETNSVSTIRLSSPYMLHVGERSLLYHYLKKMYRREQAAVDFAPLFYLYLLIKVRCRREFIQTNNLIGLTNYQDYEENNRKDELEHLGELRKRYAIQTALGLPFGKNYLESRIKWRKPDDNNPQKQLDVNIEKGIFGNWFGEREKLLNRCRLVVSYNKRYYTWDKKENWLMDVIETFDEIYRRVLRNNALKHEDFSVVGIDFTGSDRMARPEVYAPLIRYARGKAPKPFRQFTYHAGEDFFDLMDGLRTIDEILILLKWDKHCRLGHCLAIATTPADYYEHRGWNVIAPRQVLMDNLAWFLGKMKTYKYPLRKDIVKQLEGKAAELYAEIGYTEGFALDKYQGSMTLRGDHPLTGVRGKGGGLLVQSSLDPDASLIALRSDAVMMGMFNEYFKPTETQYEKGAEVVSWKIPRGIAGGMKRIQKELMKDIASKEIAVETCPTSNYMIGHFDKYVELPIMTFLKEMPNNDISINTDDKGIIATSIENEYALMMLAMKKERRYTKDAKKFIDKAFEGAEKSKF